MPETLVAKTGELQGVAQGLLRPVLQAIGRGLRQIHVRRKLRTLHLQETLALGDKRFLAVVEWKNEQLLIGVTPHSITLLEPKAEKEVRKFAWEKERIA
jgi:flagellar biogenesis protein FliO